jgi:hypothetical protein
MRKPITALLLLLSFAAFAQKEQKDPYTGVSKSQIAVWFGQPETRDSNAKGEILTFMRVRKASYSHRIPIDPKSPDGPPPNSPVNRIEAYKFFFDKKDLVYSWRVDTL